MDYVKRQFGDEAGVQLRDSDLITWINNGQLELARKLRNIQASMSAAVVASNGVFSVPDDTLKLESVILDNVFLTPTNFEGARALLGDKIGYTGEPEFWWVWANQIFVYPVPQAAGTITINYIARPDPVVNASSTLSLSDLYYNQLCDYVMMKAHELDENLQASQVMAQRLENGIIEVLNIERSEHGAFPVVTEVSYYD
jgi:hypothetical protein